MDRVTRACYLAGDDLAVMQAGVLRELRRVVGFDAAAFMGAVDPGTLLFTAAFVDDVLAASGPLFLDNEFGASSDVNRFVDLAAAADPVASLDRSTAGDWGASARYREIMAPLGLGDEARVALRANGTTWGFLCLHRSGPTSFDASELATLRRIGPHFAEAIRRTVTASSGPVEELTSVVAEPALIIAADDHVVAMGGQAEHWLAELDCPATIGHPLPLPLLVLARRLTALDRGDPTTPPATIRLRTRSGPLVTVHATHLREASGDPSIAFTIAPAVGAERTSLLLSAHGLTGAQQRVAQLVLRGLTTRQITGQLRISEHTVQDHLKAVFDKVGVRSRRDLVAALMHTSS